MTTSYMMRGVEANLKKSCILNIPQAMCSVI